MSDEIALGMPLLIFAGVLLTAGQLLRGRRIPPRHPLSRRAGLLAVLIAGTILSLAATVFAQLMNFGFADAPVDLRGNTLLLGQSIPDGAFTAWIIITEISPPLLVTTIVAMRMLPRDRRMVVAVGGAIALLPTLLLLLLDLWISIRSMMLGGYY